MEQVILGAKPFTNNLYLYVDNKKVILKDNELDIEMDLSDKIETLDKIIINGITFIREK